MKSDAPLPMMKNAEDDKLRDQPIRIQLPGKLQGTWCAMAARLTLAANVAAFLMPIGYVAYDRVLHQWIGPAIYFRFESGRPRQTSMLEAHAEFWILATIWPAVLAFIAWYYMALRNARLMAAGMIWPEVAVALLFLPFVNLIVLYYNMQAIWRASDPESLEDSESWKMLEPSWLVRAWGLSLLPVFVCCIMLSFCVIPIMEPLLCLCLLSIPCTDILSIIIIRTIMKRQQERYRCLYADVITKA